MIVIFYFQVILKSIKHIYRKCKPTFKFDTISVNNKLGKGYISFFH